MLIQFLYSDDMVRVINLEEGSLVDKLKPAVYYIRNNPMMGFFLEKEHDNFAAPPQLFGPVKRRIEKIKTTFDDRINSTGVLLTGDKGSGKTMLAEVLCNEMITAGIPVIIIDERYTGSNFTSFIDSLGVVVLFFDEFGKTYPVKQRNTDDGNDSQESLLSLLDGVNRQKRLVIMTENNEYDINDFIKSRPGRVFYHFKYKKLDEETIKEFSESENIPRDIADCVLDASRKMDEFSFDTLKAIIEEYKRFGGSADNFEEILIDLNIDFDRDKKIKLKIVKLIEKETNKEIEVEFTSMYQDKPEQSNCSLYVELKRSKKEGEKEQWEEFYGYQIKYTSDKKVVFDNDEYLLVTEIEEDFKYAKYNYSAF